MGKPSIKIDIEKLRAFCRTKPTLADCAAFFQCSEDTIERRIKENEGCTFKEFRERHMVHTRYDLVRMAIKRASKSDTMLIFCLKNMCGWKDKQNEDRAGIDIKVDLAERLAQARQRAFSVEIEDRIKQIKEGEVIKSNERADQNNNDD